MGDKAKKDKNQHIQVFVRVRPLNQNEKNKASPSIIETTNKEVTIKERPLEKISRTFAYDRVFGMESTQIEVYTAVVAPLIDEVLQGYNCTVFAYGQTGTGKTFTMEGVQSDNLNGRWNTDPSSGIIPRALSHLFDELRILQAEYTVRVSLLELYNEELFDLLSPTDDVSKIKLYEDVNKKGSVIISGLEEITVHNKNEVYKIMEKGSLKRQTAATLMNAHSSRSHTVFSITVHIKENSLDGEELLKTGKLNLVDLAGSENVGKSGAIDKRAREAGNINQSLLTLGRCITSLVERTPHIPFRESKLTRLLQDSLGGRTKTSIIATISPAACNMEETMSTLDYALRAKNITNRPEINQKLTKKALLKEYTEEIERLRRDLAATRDKNGVYLANENYTQMISQLESQEQEILAKIDNLKAVHQEMEKKETLLNELRISLDEKNEQLETTTTELVQTRATLEHTEVLLKKTEVDRDEHSHLVEKHVETEEQLGQQARSLLAVADKSTTDTYRLHDKLSRKRSVEDNNAQVTQEFHQEYQQKLVTMVNSVSRFNEEQLKYSATLQSSLGQHLEAGATGLSAVSELMSSFLQDLDRQTVELQAKTSAQAATGQEWTQQYLSSRRGRSDAEGGAVHEYRVEVMRMNQNLAHQMNTLESDQQEQSRYINQQLRYQREKVQDHTVLQDQRLAQLAALVQQLVQAQQSENDRTRAAVLSFQAEVNTKLEKREEELTQVIEKVKSDKVVFNETLAQISVGFTRAAENYDKLHNTVVSAMNSESSHASQFNKVFQTDVNDLNENFDSNVEQSQTSLTDAKRTHSEVESMTNEALLSAEEAWKEDYGRCEQELRQRSEVVHTQLQDQQDCVQGVLSTTRRAADRHEEAIERQRSELTVFVRGARAGVDAQVVHLGEWTQETSSELRLRKQDVDKFLTEELRCDMPTGNTPVRQEFHYSRVLPATSPHDRILTRFRAIHRQNMLDQPQDDSSEVSSLSTGDSMSTSGEVVVEAPPDGAEFFVVPRSSSTNDLPSTVSAGGDLNLSATSEPGYKHESKENSRSLFLAPSKPTKIRSAASKSKLNNKVQKPASGHKTPLTATSLNHQL